MISYAAAFVTALLNATSNVLNRKATRDEPARFEFRLRLITDLMHRRTWLVAVTLMALSFGTGAAALGTGQLAAVQPIITLELPMTIIGESWLLGSRLRKRGWAAIAAMTAAIVVLLVSLDPRPGPHAAISPAAWIIGSAVNAGVLAALVFAGWTSRSPARRAALLGTACGLGFGLAAAYAKGMTQQFTAGGIVGVLVSWQLYAAAAAGAGATWLLQNAYRAGRLVASQPGTTLADPVAAIVWGVLVFGERVRAGLFLIPAVLAVLALAAAVVVLSRSPGMQGAAGQSETEARRRVERDEGAGREPAA